KLISSYTRDELITKLEGTGLPFAPIGRPQDMFDDPHLNNGDGLEETILPDGTATKLPALPIAMGGKRPSQSFTMPEPGADVHETLAALGYDDKTIEDLLSTDAVG
ncbi:CoA transferase, partial [Parasphingorhabdus sp. JC815]|uniref:CoA transferase n=1 Tax=Parasphingorhabdus sp. JC815 TaxID=3232140 RepID=UPI003458B932